MNYELMQGDCLQTLKTLPAASVQTCVTSPPYYGLRDYGHDGQIGLEETPEAYVAKLVDVFREVRRVLRDDGTLWLNLGDSYATGTTAPRQQGSRGIGEATQFAQDAVPRIGNPFGCKTKDLIGIPWLVAFALRADGWWLRSDIIWHKPNPMPESVTDRPTKSHEYIFLLSKSQSYFYDADAIREPFSEAGKAPQKYGRNNMYGWNRMADHRDGRDEGPRYESDAFDTEIGRNKRTVWTVNSRPYEGAHFAVYPAELIEPCILAGTSAHGACSECGAPWERITDIERTNPISRQDRQTATGGAISGGVGKNFPERTIRGESWQPTCACNADVVPCVVLDPFAGSGTTLAVALKHGRHGIGCELNEDYIELAHKRITQAQPMLLGVA